MITNDHLTITRQLLEVISPDGEIFEQSIENFEGYYIDALSSDLSPLWAIYQAGKGKITFVIQEDIAQLLYELRMISSYWQADLFLGDIDGEDESLYDLAIDAILSRAAMELQNYGLLLWLWETEESNTYLGFLSREEDSFLIERYSEQLDENFQQIMGNDF